MKMPMEGIRSEMFAPCGMNCMVCYKHCYHKKPCAGCIPGDEGKPEHCRKCKVKDCVREKELSYCYECPEYPCRQLKSLEKSYNTRYHASLVENSHMVQTREWKHLWRSKKRNLPVRSVEVLFLFMMRSAVSVSGKYKRSERNERI